MKRTKFIAGALVLSMGLLGTGYAYWTDALQVNTTVSTGHMKFQFDCSEDRTEGIALVEKEGAGSEADISARPGLLNGDTGRDTDKLTIEANNLYPGVDALIRTNFVVDTSITANLTATIEGDSVDLSKFKFAVAKSEAEISDGNKIKGAKTMTKEELADEILKLMSDGKDETNGVYKVDASIEPTAKPIFIGIEVNENAENQGQGGNAKFTINIEAKQYNHENAN